MIISKRNPSRRSQSRFFIKSFVEGKKVKSNFTGGMRPVNYFNSYAGCSGTHYMFARSEMGILRFKRSKAGP